MAISIWMIFIFTALAVNKMFGFRTEYIDHHNLGYVLHKDGEITVMTAEAKMIFNYELPPVRRLASHTVNCTQYLGRNARDGCEMIKDLLRAFVDVEVIVSHHLQEQLRNVFDATHEFQTLSNQSMAKRGFLSQALGRVTGLATAEDLQRLRDVMLKVEQGIQTAADAWTVGSKRILASYKIEQSRCDNIHRLLMLQRRSLNSLQTEVLNLFIQA